MIWLLIVYVCVAFVAMGFLWDSDFVAALFLSVTWPAFPLILLGLWIADRVEQR